MPPRVTRRRLPRLLLNAATAVSLVLCVTAVALWVRSYFRWEFIRLVRGVDELRLRSEEGVVSLSRFHEPSGGPWPSAHVRYEREFRTRYPDGYRYRRLFAFGIAASGDGADWKWYAGVPHWSAAVMFALLPLVRRRALLARFRTKPGRCPACGYDLRATSDRCPECGGVPPSAR